MTHASSPAASAPSHPSAAAVALDPAAMLAAERASVDLRRGLPALLCDADGVVWELLAVDGLDQNRLDEFLTDRTAAALWLAGPRARALGLSGDSGVGAALALAVTPGIDAARLAALSDPTLPGPGAPPDFLPRPPADLSAAALELAKLAELLPAVIAAPCRGTSAAQAVARIDAVLAYRRIAGGQVRRVSQATVPLVDSQRTRIVAYRPGDGGPDHLAVVIGDPDLSRPVLARLHSSCITGDLLGSLRCDCGDQLRGAIKAIADAGGGVLLYLQQEGRGIGIAAKLRAYVLQDDGLDTIDANDQLGFAADERRYAAAAAMFRDLGVTSVRLMTNNPSKLEALTRHGVAIAERVAHQFPTNPHNERYLAAKAAKAGHMLI